MLNAAITFGLMCLIGIGSGCVVTGLTNNGDRGAAAGIGMFVLAAAFFLYRWAVRSKGL